MEIELLNPEKAEGLLYKTAKVISSCETMSQLACAEIYTNLARKKLQQLGLSEDRFRQFQSMISVDIGVTRSRINRAKRS